MDEVTVCSHDCPELSIIFPPNYNYIHHIDSSLKVMWDFKSYSSSAEYQISVVNIFNELLYELKTKDKECIIPPEKIQTKEGLLIVRLQIDNHHSEIGIRTREAYEDNYQMDYQLLLIAIEMSFKRSDMANDFFQRDPTKTLASSNSTKIFSNETHDSNNPHLLSALCVYSLCPLWLTPSVFSVKKLSDL